MGAEDEVGADSFCPPHKINGRSDPLAYVIYTTCKSCYLVFVWDNAELDSITHVKTPEPLFNVLLQWRTSK